MGDILMQEIYKDRFLSSKYDTLQLMVFESVATEIEDNVEKLMAKHIKNINSAKELYVDVWVSKTLYAIYRDLKYTQFKLFTHHVTFCLNNKMNDDQFKIYNIGLKIADNYKLEDTKES